MSSGAESCIAGCCGICCIFGSASLGSWAYMAPWGAGGCCNRGGGAGCCGSCCNKSFDDDAFEREVQKDMARTRASDAEIAASQPKATQGMSTDLAIS